MRRLWLRKTARGDSSAHGERGWADPSFFRATFVTVRAVIIGPLPVFLVGGLALQIRRDLDISISAIGAAVAVFFAASTLTAVPIGRLADLLGPTRSLQSAALISVASLLGLTFSRSFLGLTIGLGVGGVANAAAHVSSNLFIVCAVGPGRQGLAFGFKQAAVPGAMMVGGLAVPALGLTIGWRWAFGLAAVGAVLHGVGLRERWVGSHSMDVSGGRSGSAPLGLLAAGAALGTAMAAALWTFFVDSTVLIGFSESTAGFLLAAGGAIALLMRVGAGWWVDRREGATLAVVLWLMLVGLVGVVALATRMSMLVPPAVVLAFGGAWGWSGLLHLAAIEATRGAPASATGVTQTGAFAGGIVGPPVVGVAAEHSYSAAWGVAALCGLLGWLVVALSRRVLERRAARND